ncbi:hypothetical protein C0J52_15001 [Blattella germanica]|nr:hypothetical protein C0J52_15001 [Blattella germanica]
MPRRRRPDLGRRSQSNVQRHTSRANGTDDQRERDNENNRIRRSELRSRVSENEVDMLRTSSCISDTSTASTTQ